MTFTPKMAKSLTKGTKPGMTRRHFEFIAHMLKTAQDKHPNHPWKLICEHFADNLAQTNGGFDRHRFLSACGVV